MFDFLKSYWNLTASSCLKVTVNMSSVSVFSNELHNSVTHITSHRVQNPWWLLSDIFCPSNLVLFVSKNQLTRLIYIYTVAQSVWKLWLEKLGEPPWHAVWIDIREPSITVCLAILLLVVFYYWTELYVLYFTKKKSIICKIDQISQLSWLKFVIV